MAGQKVRYDIIKQDFFLQRLAIWKKAGMYQ